VGAFADLKTSTFMAGATSIGADHHVLPTFMNELLGTQIKVITGYSGPRAFFVAVERGELDGAISALSEIFGRPNIRVLVQFGAERHPSLADIPTAAELASGEARSVFDFYSLKYKLARPVIMPPDVPAERVDAMRRAFDATVKDPAFIEAAGKLGMDVAPLGGEEVTRLIAQIQDTPQPIIDRVRAMVDPTAK
jgi:tripartite-type tricarboxylate transporter receptor subunit TctC